MAVDKEIEDLLGGGTIRGNGPQQPQNEVGSEPQYVNTPKDAPTVFSDGLLFATIVSGSVRLQFAEYVPQAINGPDPGLKTRVVANVVMPLEGYRSMMQYLEMVNGPYIFGEDANDGD